MRYYSISLFIAFLLTIGACRQAERSAYVFQKSAFSKDGMVVSAHPLATQAGIDILREGGNAVDAAIAVQLTLAVVYPRAGNIGGGGFIVYRSANGESTTLDFREKAPKFAHRDMYLDDRGDVIPGRSTDGHLASGVPGTVAGLVACHQKYGSLPWERLCQSAVHLARKGHPITHFEAERLNELRELFIKYNGDEIPFVSASAWEEGDILRQPELAQTLELIAHEGREGFYAGKTAEFILNEMQEGEGLITQADLDAYQPVWRKPITTDYRGYRLISMPPPSSGGIALAQLLEIVEGYPLNTWGHRDIRSIHLMIEAERRVYADRATYLGDADFYPVPKDTLLDASYLSARMRDFNPVMASKSESIQADRMELTIESYETTHFTIVDGKGNAVAVTTTLNGNYGSKVIVDGAGFFLNNEMDDFSVKPGVPNMFGLIGGEANAIEPEKRMLSSMTPTIVEKEGKLFMTLGTPGGSTIITSVFQVFLNVVEFNMSATEAIAEKRFHHQWLPDEISYEQGCFSDSLRSTLTGMDHVLKEITNIGLVEVIHVLPDGTYEGAADPREGSHAQGLD
ncbi:MAG TPA: gamma-glutamyltransferase [Saprospiraceae bacterium]|nr:gamma-glutamyltransferase [Saprospiraceae bacterium]